MGVNENRYATEIRRRLLYPPNAVADPGIDLKRRQKTCAAPTEEPVMLLCQQILESQALAPTSNVLPFKSPATTVMRVISLVSSHSGVCISDILSTNRAPARTFARHVAYWLCIKHFPNRSLPQLALVFKRDHSTLVHGRDRIRRYLGSGSPEGDKARDLIAKVEGDIYGESLASVSEQSEGLHSMPPSDSGLPQGAQDSHVSSEGSRPVSALLEG